MSDVPQLLVSDHCWRLVDELGSAAAGETTKERTIRRLCEALLRSRSRHPETRARQAMARTVLRILDGGAE